MDDLKKHANIARNIDIKSVLQRSCAQKDKHDKAKWLTRVGTLSVTGQQFFNWNQNRGGGGAIDLVIHLYECDFKTALCWLLDNFSLPGVSERAPETEKPRFQSHFILPEREDRYLERVA